MYCFSSCPIHEKPCSNLRLAVTSLESLGSVLSWDIFVQEGNENQPPRVIAHFICLPKHSYSSYYDEHPDCLYPVLEFQFEKSGLFTISIHLLPYLTEKYRKKFAPLSFFFFRLSFTIPLNLKNDKFVLQFFILEQLDKMDLHA